MTSNVVDENYDVMRLQETFTHVPKAMINAALQIRTVHQLNEEEQTQVAMIKERLLLGDSLDNVTNSHSKMIFSNFPDIKINDVDIDGKLRELYMAVSKNQKNGAINTAMNKVLEVTSKFPLFGKLALNKLEEQLNETSIAVAMDQIRDEMGGCIKDLEDAQIQCEFFKQDCLVTANQFEIEIIALSEALEEMDNPEAELYQEQDFNQMDNLISRRYDILRRIDTLKKIVVSRRIYACKSINLQHIIQMSLTNAVEANLLGITELDSTISYGNSLNRVLSSQKFVIDLNEGIKEFKDSQSKHVKTSIENISKMTNLMTPEDMLKEIQNLQLTRNAIVNLKDTIETQLEASEDYHIEVTKLIGELYGASQPKLIESAERANVLKPSKTFNGEK